MVRVACRNAHGKLELTLSGIATQPLVSRLYTFIQGDVRSDAFVIFTEFVMLDCVNDANIR
ncbi:MAG: hypothetical protein AB8B64_09615, partial [Granulosicoccus sp.]